MTEPTHRPSTELEPYGGVPEGDLPAGIRPTPGPCRQRLPWTGREENGQPVLLNPDRDPSAEVGARRQLAGKRIIGIDVARGLALIGMIAVHTLSSWDVDTQRSTAVFWLAAGNAAALFALLAGVGLALLSGGSKRVSTQQMWSYRGRIALRAVLIFALGMTIGQLLDLPVFNILPYYGVLFLMAIPFLHVRKRTLAGWAAGLVVIAPLVMYFFLVAESFVTYDPPNFLDLLMDPVGMLGTLLFTGGYPAVTWFVYVLVGMIVGRLALANLSVQISLLGYGTLIAMLGQGLSYLSVWYLGGWERMLYSEAQVTVSDVTSIIYRGAEDTDLPTTSLAWLTVASPHTNTPFALIHTVGIALAVLGATLLVCRFIPQLLGPLGKIGAMTLSLYVGHLAFISLGFYEFGASFWFSVQIVAAIAFAFGWTLIFRQGPLEMLVAKVSEIPVRLVQDPDDAAQEKRHHGRHRGQDQ